MNIPGYDACILRGPDENAGPFMKACENCDGTGMVNNYGIVQDCNDCCGSGEVETELDETDSDYLYERARDAKWEDA